MSSGGQNYDSNNWQFGLLSCGGNGQPTMPPSNQWRVVQKQSEVFPSSCHDPNRSWIAYKSVCRMSVCNLPRRGCDRPTASIQRITPKRQIITPVYANVATDTLDRRARTQPASPNRNPHHRRDETTSTMFRRMATDVSIWRLIHLQYG